MRRYPPFQSTPNRVTTLPSQGVVLMTSNRRRYPQFGRTRAQVKTLDSLGTVQAAQPRRHTPLRITQAVNRASTF